MALALLAAGCPSFHELGQEAAPTHDGGAADGRPQKREAGAVDAGRDAKAAPRADAGVDAGPPTGDFACNAPWNDVGDAGDPRCKGVRTVSLVQSGTYTVGGISIARTAAGRIGIAYDNLVQSAAQGVELATFIAPPASSTKLSPTMAETGFRSGSHVGVPCAVTAGGPADTLMLAYVDEDVEELDYQELAQGGPDLSAIELVATGIGTGSYLSLASTSSGGARAAYFVPALGAIRSAARVPSGGFGAPSEIVSGLVPGPPGVGQVSLFIDATDTPNVLYSSGITSNYSTAVYASFDGTSWSQMKTLENDSLTGYSGYSPSLVVVGPNKYAGYFFVPSGERPPFFGELHLASWQTFLDMPAVQILASGLAASSANQETLDLRFATALAVDRYGLLHMVVVRSMPSSPSPLEYTRQAIVDGTVTWLTDEIDADVLGSSDDAPNAFAALVVDDAARPHIAYRSGRDGNVYYATRFDR